MFTEASSSSSRIPIEFHLEAGHLLYFYYEPAMALDHINAAVKLSGLDVQLTGKMVCWLNEHVFVAFDVVKLLFTLAML